MNKIKDLYFKYEEVINYLIVGVLTTVVSLFTYYICVTFFLDPNNPIQLQIANVISWICAVLFAFYTNRKFVFKSKTKDKEKIKEFFKFVNSRIVTLLIDMFMMFVMVSVLSMNDKIAKLLVQVVVIVLNYVFSKILVFKNKDNKNEGSK